MSFTVPIFSRSSLSDTADSYYHFSNCYSGVNTSSEANASQRWYGSGKISFFTVWINSNSSTSTDNVYLRINGASVNQTVAIGAGLTGEFVDSVNTDNYADGDDISIFFDRNGFSISPTFMGAHVTPDSDAVMKLGAFGTATWSNNSSARYPPLCGDAGYSSSASTSEGAASQLPIDCSATLKNLNCYETSSEWLMNDSFNLSGSTPLEMSQALRNSLET
jgi:hypothetical protein